MLGFFILLLLFALASAKFAADRFHAALKAGSKVTVPGAMTAAEAVREFLDENDANDVKIKEHNALVSDYYDSKRRCLFLNQSTMMGTDAASWSLALHEAAHALQTGESAQLYLWRQGNIRLTRYAPTLIAIVCLLLSFLKRLPFRSTLMICSVLFALIMLVNLLSTPIERNASARVMTWLDRRLEKYPSLLDTFAMVLAGVAWRDTAVFLKSPSHFFYGFMPMGGKLRPKK